MERTGVRAQSIRRNQGEVMTIEKKPPFQVLEKNTSLSAWTVLDNGHMYAWRTEKTLLMWNRGDRNPKTQSMAEMELLSPQVKRVSFQKAVKK